MGTRRIVECHAQRAPNNILAAQYSLPFSVAVALSCDINNPYVYSEETLRDIRIQNLAKSEELAIDGERFGKPGGPVADFSLTMAGGTYTFTVNEWGHVPTNP